MMKSQNVMMKYHNPIIKYHNDMIKWHNYNCTPNVLFDTNNASYLPVRFPAFRGLLINSTLHPFHPQMNLNFNR